MPISLQYPFINGDHGFVSFPDEDFEAAIQQNFKFLLLTIKGEYTMDATFGVGLQELLFDFPLVPNLELVKSEIETQVNKFMPYIRVDNVNFTPENNVLYTRIEYTILETNTARLFEFTQTIA